MFLFGLRATAALYLFMLSVVLSAQSLQPFHKFSFNNTIADAGTGGATLMPEGQPFPGFDRFGNEFSSLNVSRANVFMQDGRAFQGSFTVTMWYRAEGNQNAPYAGFWSIDRRTGSQVPEYGAQSAFGFNQMEFEGGGRKYIATQAPLANGRWERITCVQDTATKTRALYINGAIQNGDQRANYRYYPPELDAKVVFGRKSEQASLRLYGLIDDIAIFDHALTAAQIDSSYRAEADLEPPANPTFFDAEYIVNQVLIRWTASTDNHIVEKYRVFQNSQELGETTARNPQWGLLEPDIMPGDRITINVVAYDFTGNPSDTVAMTYVHPGASAVRGPAFAKTPLEIAPNPVTAGASLRIAYGDEVTAGEIQVYDPHGRVIARGTSSSASETTFSTVGWAPGAYLVVLRTPTGARRVRALVQ